MATGEMDMITKKPRTARDPYTTLTDVQISNLKKDPQAFFMFSKPEKPYPEKGWYLDRYATCTNEHLFRGHLTEPFCWIDSQWQRDPPKDHNASILGASQRWGPDKVGVRTVQHFNKPEDPNRFVNTELYRRQNTNRHGIVHQKYGRPGEGYYLMRNPRICRSCHGKCLEIVQNSTYMYPANLGDEHDEEEEEEVFNNKMETDAPNQPTLCTKKNAEKELSGTDESMILRPRQTACFITNVDSQLDSSQHSSINYSQESSWSNCEEARELKELNLQHINQALGILSQGAVSPLRSKLSVSIDHAKVRTLRYYKRKAKETIDVLFEAIAPNQGHILKNLMYSADGEKADDKDLIEVVKQMYFNLNDSNTKCQLLSLVVNKYTKAELMSCFKGVTKHQIDTARKHAFVHGPGSSLPSRKSTHHRQRISEEKLHHAIDFFSNPSFNQISSYSTKQMKLDTGETLEIPEIVRTVIHSNLIKMYKIYCKENDFIPVSDATLFQILKACSASQRKCLKGLDNVAVDGAAAYDNLLSITKKLDQPENWKQGIQKKIIASNLYMKTEFKVHIQKESECAFHCQTFALSDLKSANFKEVCPHEHTKRCENCELVQNLASEIENAILTSALEDLDKDSLLQELKISVQQINDWRSHIVRTINQDDARHTIIGSLKINQVLIVMDWAMKYLPFKFREKMTDWFGQKGVHWHISVCIFRGQDGELMHKTFTHILDHVKQDFFAVLSLLEHTLQSIKRLLPAIDEAFIRSDNAGCYHCGHLWLSIPRLSDRTDSQTWFGSTVPLNRTGILQDIRPKTTAEYEMIHNQQKEEVLQRKGKFPAYSEYTDRIGIKTKLQPIMTTRQRRKMYLEGEL